MPKWKGYYDGQRKYQKCWEKAFGWLRAASDDAGEANCKLCNTAIKPKLDTLKKHAATTKHKKAEEAAGLNKKNSQPKINFKPISNDLKKTEILLSVSMACHCAIRTIDHLGEIIHDSAKGSLLENMKLHRTKCTKILTEVVAPAILNEIFEDLKGCKYSLILDESTDVCSQKHLALCARYFSNTTNTMKTSLLGLLSVTDTTGETIFQMVKDYLKSRNISLENCVGLGTDGGSNLCGKNNSFWSRLQIVSPNCILLKCICHSLALCCEKAFEELPGNLEFLMSEIPKWFKRSALRREDFKRLFSIMNDGEATGAPFIMPSKTRWLVRGECLYRILTNWHELLGYFDCLQESKCENRYKARLIRDMLRDKQNFLYLQFCLPIIWEFERLNQTFQATDADPQKLVAELESFYFSLKSRIVTPANVKKVIDINQHMLPLDDIDFGSKFMMEVSKSGIKIEEANGIKVRCLNFLKTAVGEVEKRLPGSLGAFKNLSKLSPQVCLCQIRPKILELPFAIKENDLAEVEEQYRKLLHIDWTQNDLYSDKSISQDTVQFWGIVSVYNDAVGNRPFKKLAEYALSSLTLPVSNAVVERVFSQVTLVKTKVRNAMSLKLLQAILTIKTSLQFERKCCKDFVVTDSMIKLFCAEMYKEIDESKISREEEEEIDELLKALP